jgi:hypothetical protein
VEATGSNPAQVHSFSQITEFLVEVKLEELGIKEHVFIDLFKDIPKLSRKEKKKIIKVSLKIKKKKS